MSLTGVQGICPAGWHLPTDAEWTILTTFLGGESIAGGKMKTTGTIEAGTGLWYAPNTGATNESGFSALPGGCRYDDGGFYYWVTTQYFWSSTEYDTSSAWYRDLGLQLRRCILLSTTIRTTVLAVVALRIKINSARKYYPCGLAFYFSLDE